jgi:hypothetical protein
MNANKEKIALFDDAIVYHSCKEEISKAESEWIEWARIRVIELEMEGS